VGDQLGIAVNVHGFQIKKRSFKTGLEASQWGFTTS